MSLNKHLSVSSRLHPKVINKHDYGLMTSDSAVADPSGGIKALDSKYATKQFLEQAHNKLQMSQNFFFRH